MRPHALALLLAALAGACTTTSPATREDPAPAPAPEDTAPRAEEASAEPSEPAKASDAAAPAAAEAAPEAKPAAEEAPAEPVLDGPSIILAEGATALELFDALSERVAGREGCYIVSPYLPAKGRLERIILRTEDRAHPFGFGCDAKTLSKEVAGRGVVLEQFIGTLVMDKKGKTAPSVVGHTYLFGPVGRAYIGRSEMFGAMNAEDLTKDDFPGSLKVVGIPHAKKATIAPLALLARREVSAFDADAFYPQIAGVLRDAYGVCVSSTGAQGSMTVDLLIDAKGKIAERALTASSFEDAKIAGCVLERLEAQTYPPAKDGALISLPIVFE